MDEGLETIRPLEVIRAQLSDLRAAKADLAEAPTNSLATRATLASLEANEASLEAEEAAAVLVRDGHSFELALKGDAVVGYTIQASFLSEVLGRFQRLLDGVAQVRAGQATRAGQVPEDVRDGVRMMVAALVPSSFAIRVEVPEQPGQLFGDDAVRTTLHLFAAEPEIESFLPLMRVPRVKSSFAGLAKSLVSAGSELRIRTNRGTTVRFTAQMARDRLDWIDLVETKENVLDLRGVLVGGNVESGSYVLAVEDRHYRGKVLDSALGELRRVALGSQVRARLLRVVKEQVDGIVTPLESFYLESIVTDVDDQTQL